MRAFVRLAAASVLSLAAVTCTAAPFAVQVGDARLGLDAPPGFADTGFTGSPRLQELAESLTSASNRILLFAISDGDLRKFMVGDPPELRRYMLVVTPKGMEHERITMDKFAFFVDESLRELGRPPPAGKSFTEVMNTQPMGRGSLLAELRRDTTVVSVLQGTRLPPMERSDTTPHYLLSTTTLLLLKGKPVNLSVFTGFETPADLEWIRTTTTRWIDELQRLNRRP